MSLDNETLYNDLLKTIRGMDPLPMGKYLQRLHNKARASLWINDDLRRYLKEEPRYPPDDANADNVYMDGKIITDLLGWFTNANFVRAMDNVDSQRDKYNFRESLSMNGGDLDFLKVVTSLTSYCYGEYINGVLDKAGIGEGEEGLLWLAGRFGFQDYLLDKVLNPSFVAVEFRTDVQRGDHVFSMLMLYILDYMYYGGPQAIPCYDDDYENRPSFKVVGAWSWQTWESDARGNDSKTDQLVSFCGKCASLGMLPVRDSESPRPQQLFTCTKALYDLLSGGDWLDKNIKKPKEVIDEYKQAMKNSIDRLQVNEDAMNQWKTDCMSMKNTWLNTTFSDWQSAIDDGLVDSYTTQYYDDKIQVTGEPVHKWIYDGYYGSKDDPNWWQMFLSEPPDNREVINNGGGGSCFRAGTKINIDHAVKNIEDIQEWDRILTLSDPDQYGSASSEKVVHSIDDSLIGFNGETPFATPGHIFFTTTGLRAVDPSVSKRENPWAKVGPLKEGHVLYRLRNGGQSAGYETVEVQSITKSGAGPRKVYGVHLHEGLRSYHADGYLVSLNYPEITIKSIIDLLKSFPPKRRIALIQSLQELRPLFQTFGAQTVSDRLSLEINGADGADGTLRKSVHSKSHQKGKKTNEPDAFQLKQPGRRYNRRVDLDRITRSYQLQPRSNSATAKEHVFPKVTIAEGVLLLDETVEPRSRVDTDDSTARWSRKLGLQGEFEHGWLRFDSTGRSATGAIVFSQESNPSSLSKKDVVSVWTGPSRTNKQAPTNTRTKVALSDDTDEDGGQLIEPWDYDITIDKEVWDPDTDRDKAKQPFQAGKITDIIYVTKEGFLQPQAAVPALDQLQEYINKTLRPNEPPLDPFYTVSVGDPPGGGDVLYNIEMNQAQLIPFISGSGSELDIKLYDVSFKESIGLDLTLPFLWQSLHFQYTDADLMEFTGAVYEYDPSMRGNKGNRHFLSGTMSLDTFSKEMRSKASKGMTAYAKPNQPQNHTPSNITHQLYAASECSVDELMKMPNYNEQDVHSTSQTLIQNMMYYHMDQDQREKFLSASKPTNLPPELTTGLSADIQKFFRDQYAPAFISRSICQISDYKKKFTEAQARKIDYWWEGTGPTCLSKAKEYTTINNLTSIYAIRQLYKPTIDKYLESKDGPKYWAEQMYNTTKAPRILSNLCTSPVSNGNNVVNQRCCILNALDPNSTYGEDLFRDIVAYATAKVPSSPFNGIDASIAEQWLNDSMYELIVKVLNNDPSISAEIRATLLQQLSDFENANGLNQQASDQDRAAAIVQTSAFLAGELSRWTSAFGTGVAKIFEGTRLFTWAGTAFDKASDNISTAGKKNLKGIATIALAGFYLVESIGSVIGIIEQWENLSDSQKTVAILETLHQVVDAISNVSGAWKRYANQTGSYDVDAQLDAAQLDNSLEKYVKNNGDGLSDMADNVTGEDNAMKENIADHLEKAGPKSEGDGSRTERWNESNEDVPEKIPPGAAEEAKKFSMSGQWLNALNAIIGLATTVAMAFSLAYEWDKLNDAGKAINTLSVIVQGLSVLLDIVEIGISTGALAVGTAFASAIPIIGAVLAVIGFVLTIVSFFVNLFSKPDPPPDPVQDFVDDIATPFLNDLDAAPDPKLQYSASPVSVKGGTTTGITVSLKNTSTQDVVLNRVSISLYSGTDEICLYHEDAFSLVDQGTKRRVKTLGGDAFTASGGQVRADPTAKIQPRLDQTVFSTQTNFDLNLFGNPANEETPLGELLLKPSETFTVVWTGGINPKGKDISDSTIEVFEVTSTDNSRQSLTVTRT